MSNIAVKGQEAMFRKAAARKQNRLEKNKTRGMGRKEKGARETEEARQAALPRRTSATTPKEPLREETQRTRLSEPQMMALKTTSCATRFPA
jgi:hypothetical protein